MRPLLAAALVLASVPASGQTRIVKGFVVDERNRPMPNARISFVTIGSPEVLGPQAEFRYAVPAATTSVVVVLLEPKDYVIRYPVGGSLLVAVDNAPAQPIVIGPPLERVALDAGLDNLLQIERVLKLNGKQLDDTAAMLAGMRPLLEKLKLPDSELPSLLERRRAQNEIFSDVSVILDTYVLRVKDFRDALTRLAPAAFTDQGSLLGLRALLVSYNDSFTQLNASREAVGGRIANAWAPSEAENVRRYWNDVMIEAIDRVHKGIVLPLSPHVEAAQVAFNTKHVDAGTGNAALAAFGNARQRLDAELPALESTIQAFRRAIERAP